ncbi:MAG: hypothetical protein WCR70_00335 [Sphaerochaetaceae bacterium]
MKRGFILVAILFLGAMLMAESLEGLAVQAGKQMVITSSSISQMLIDQEVPKTPDPSSLQVFSPAYPALEQAQLERSEAFTAIKDYLMRLWTVARAFFMDNWYYAAAYTFAFICYMVLFFTLINGGIARRERSPRPFKKPLNEDTEDIELARSIAHDFSKDKAYEEITL